MLHEDLRVGCHRLAGDVIEDGVVEDDAVLQDLDERSSVMRVRPLQHSDEMRLQERYRRVDRDHIELTMTIIDPKTYTKPWSGGWIINWHPGEDFPEYFCQDNRP